jgi:hypothetical protein
LPCGPAFTKKGMATRARIAKIAAKVISRDVAKDGVTINTVAVELLEMPQMPGLEAGADLGRSAEKTS